MTFLKQLFYVFLSLNILREMSPDSFAWNKKRNREKNYLGHGYFRIKEEQSFKENMQKVMPSKKI